MGIVEDDEILVEIEDQFILGFHIEKDLKRVRFIVANEFIDEIEMGDITPFKNKLHLVKGDGN